MTTSVDCSERPFEARVSASLTTHSEGSCQGIGRCPGIAPRCGPFAEDKRTKSFPPGDRWYRVVLFNKEVVEGNKSDYPCGISPAFGAYPPPPLPNSPLQTTKWPRLFSYYGEVFSLLPLAYQVHFTSAYYYMSDIWWRI